MADDLGDCASEAIADRISSYHLRGIIGTDPERLHKNIGSADSAFAIASQYLRPTLSIKHQQLPVPAEKSVLVATVEVAEDRGYGLEELRQRRRELAALRARAVGSSWCAAPTAAANVVHRAWRTFARRYLNPAQPRHAALVSRLGFEHSEGPAAGEAPAGDSSGRGDDYMVLNTELAKMRRSRQSGRGDLSVPMAFCEVFVMALRIAVRPSESACATHASHTLAALRSMQP